MITLCLPNVQVHKEMKHLVNATIVERYHVDAVAKTAIDRMQSSVSCSTLLDSTPPVSLSV